jgi:hypothetical protein
MVKYEYRAAVQQHECAGWYRLPASLVQLPAAGPGDQALGMQPPVDLHGKRDWRTVARRPSLPIGVVCRATAQRTWSVTCGKRKCLVVEEQPGEPASRPLLRPPVLVFKRACDPQVTAVKPDNVGADVQAAAIARPRTAQRYGDDVAQWCDPILLRRGVVQARGIAARMAFSRSVSRPTGGRSGLGSGSPSSRSHRQVSATVCSTGRQVKPSR